MQFLSLNSLPRKTYVYLISEHNDILIITQGNKKASENHHTVVTFKGIYGSTYLRALFDAWSSTPRLRLVLIGTSSFILAPQNLSALLIQYHARLRSILRKSAEKRLG